ncbi:MAG: TIGR01777 family protein [Chloroflexi bacterium]|nr:TIGR01777 family protein [Chloroflexota bacterium]
MHIVLTGGTGLIGRAFVAHLAPQGHTFTVFTRHPEKQPAGLPPDVQRVKWTPQDPNALARVLRQADAVVNLMGENIAAGRWNAARKNALYASRVENGRALASALRLAQPRPPVLLQASAVGYYGDRGNDLLDEHAPPGDDFLARLCVDWEASTSSVEGLGMRRVILRTGIVLSREGGALPRMMRPIQWGLGGPLGAGNQWMPWIHIHDQVAAMSFLLTHEEAHGPFNLTAPQPVTNAELTRAIARKLHRPAFLRVPAWALRLAFGEMSQVLLASQRALPQRLLELGFQFRFPTLDAALDDLLGQP